jgi:uncharacterized protein
MLLRHVGGRTEAGWTTIREDGRGLFVRGFVSCETAAGRTALQMIGDATLYGFSIGFMARYWSPRVVRGRDLKRIGLREISLVKAPMLLGARSGVPVDAITTRARRAV